MLRHAAALCRTRVPARNTGAHLLRIGETQVQQARDAALDGSRADWQKLTG